MKLWLLQHDVKQYDYDCAQGFVVAAADERRARELCAEKGNPGDEGWEFWLTSTKVTVTVIGDSLLPDEGVVLRDFLAG